MFEGLRQRRLLDIGAGPGTERAAGRGDDDPNQLFAISGTQGLKQRVVFGISRQDAGSGLRRTLHEEVAGTYQTFLVGQGHRRAAIDGGQRGLQTCRAADCGHHPIGRPGGGFDHGTFAGTALRAGARERVLQFGQSRGVGDSDIAGPEFPGEFGKALHIGMRRQRLDAVAIA